VPVEVELQYVYRGNFPPVVPIVLAGLELRRSTPLALVDTYFDTETLDLRRSRCGSGSRTARYSRG
jgi:hypothetical protein